MVAAIEENYKIRFSGVKVLTVCLYRYNPFSQNMSVLNSGISCKVQKRIFFHNYDMPLPRLKPVQSQQPIAVRNDPCLENSCDPLN